MYIVNKLGKEWQVVNTTTGVIQSSWKDKVVASGVMSRLNKMCAVKVY